MKIIELDQSHTDLEELFDFAGQEPVILWKAGHEGFVLASVDEFALEVESLQNNEEFMAYRDELFKPKATIPREEVERE